MTKNRGKETAVYEAVFRLVEQGGQLHTMTVQQIAEAAGIGKGTVYEYFASREEILSKALLYRIEREAQALCAHTDAAPGFDEKLDVLLRFARDAMRAHAAGLKTLFADVGRIGSSEAVCRRLRETPILGRLRALVGRVVEAGVREGAIARPSSEAYALVVLSGAVFGYANLQNVLGAQEDAALFAEAKHMIYRALTKG